MNLPIDEKISRYRELGERADSLASAYMISGHAMQARMCEQRAAEYYAKARELETEKRN